MLSKIFIALFIVLSAGLSSAFADAPKPLYNKTIVLSWGEVRVQVADAGDTAKMNTRSKLIAYVSESGRIFARLSRSNERGSNNTNKGPNGDFQREGQGASDISPTFDGQMFSVRNQMRSGARSIQATFNASFSSCSLRIVFGKEDGQDLYHKGMDGRMYRIKSTSVSGQSCSIRSGNALAS